MRVQAYKERGMRRQTITIKWSGWYHKEAVTAWLFSTPALVLLVLFLVLPFFMAVYLSFTNQRLLPGPLPVDFIGLRNYVRLLQDDTFLRALLNNFIFVLVVVPVQTGLAFMMALLVNQKLPGVRFFRTIYFSPVVTPMVVVAIVWSFLYNPGQGLINAFLCTISFGHLGPYQWLDSPHLALPAIIILSIWQGVGFQMVIYLAGLQGISQTLYEAARIDGASTWKRVLYITLPQLRNITIFVVVATTILAFKLYTQVAVLTQGEPEDATMTTVFYLVNQGYSMLQVGYASAISVIFFLIILVFSIIQRFVVREEREIV
jgi:multiple sugar transport system permease protein